MKWLPGGWQREDSVVRDRATAPRGTTPSTVRFDPDQPTVADPAAPRPSQPAHPTGLGPEARDVDVSAAGFRMLLVGGGLSGLVTVLCAASLSQDSSSVGTWIWQLISGVVLLWFLRSARGLFSGRGFLFDRSGFYARTRGEVVGVSWEEIAAVGVGSVPWIQNKRLANPERRQAIELYPSDPGFVARHPEFDRWRVDEPAPMPGLPGIRYRFHLPPLSRLPRQVEHVVQAVAPRKWIGHYSRQAPTPATH